MPDTAPQRDLPLGRTPTLERLLAGVRARLTRQVWLHGTGSLLVVASAWLLFAFVADWALHVPAGVRWLHLAGLIGLPAFVVWRELWKHLSRRPDRAGLAVLVERAHPELNELLVSAVQLQQEPDGSPELVGEVLAAAERSANGLNLAGVFDTRPGRRRFGAGAALASVLLALALFNPIYSGIFLRRLVGDDVAWPQLTELTVSIPNLEERSQIEITPERIDIKVARGTDVPVLVHAAGRVPSEVALHFAGGHEVLLGTSGGGQFRTLLRSLQEDVEFHVTGGDDRDGLPRVSIQVLEPPDVTGLAISIEPPSYAGLPTRVEFDHDVEVLAGTRLRIAMLPDPPEAFGSVRILPADRLIELTPMSFPAADPLSDGAGESVEMARVGLGFEWLAESSLRFRFELQDSSGLSNPDPGLFAVQVVADRAPEVQVVSPARLEIDTVPDGALALRARVDDDFGVQGLVWTSRLASGEDDPAVHPLAFELLARPEGPSTRSVIAAERVSVRSLLPPDRQPEGELVLLSVRAQDNRPDAPADALNDPSGEHPSIGIAPSLRVRIVSEDEFLRRLQDRLSRLRIQVAELEELQRQKSARTSELIASLEGDGPELGRTSSHLNSALTGQRRVGGDAEAITRELTAILESVVYARLEEQGDSVLEDLDARLRSRSSRTFEAEPWIGLTRAWSSGELSAPGLYGQLISILELSLTISGEDAPAATSALAEAGEALDLSAIHGRLLEASRAQDVARGHMEELLGRLAEWDNFQSILSLTRDILNRQKSLRDRTREYARDK